MRLPAGLLLLSYLSLTVLPMPSQVHEKRLAPIDSHQAERFTKAGTAGVAVLVGVGHYPHFSGLSELQYPVIDADTLAETLKIQRYLVLKLTDSEATRESVLNAIREAGEALAGENLTIIFFFSGHGFSVNGENYLATLDAGVRNLSSSGLSVKVVERALEKTRAARRVMWIDACREEPGKAVGDSRSFANFQAAAGTRLLLSTKAGKVSYEDEKLRQGIFSYYLVKGLQGEAAGPDGLVTFSDLASYVTVQVRSRSLENGRVQIPYEAGEATGDFLLAYHPLQTDRQTDLARTDGMKLPSPPTTDASKSHDQSASLEAGSTGSDNGTDGGFFRPGGDVSSPILVSKVEPEYSAEARDLKYSGISILSVIIDEQGMPQDIRVISYLGHGLDEKAMEAVRKWRFRPAVRLGKPVRVRVRIEVAFQLI